MKKIKLNGTAEKLKFLKDYNGDWFLFTRDCEIVNDYTEIDGEKYTEAQIDELMNNGELFFCEDCNEYVFEDDVIAIHDWRDNVIKYVCSDCAYNNYECCRDCGNYYEREDMIWTHDGDYICERCYEDNYVTCENCGEVIRYEDAIEGDYGCYFCEDCAPENGNIYQYHEFDDWELFSTPKDNEDTFYIGRELEIDNGKNEQRASECVYENLKAVCMRDGSLNNGFEIVTHPQTFNYIMDNRETIKKTFETLIDCGYESHNAETCGLHFHVTAPKENRDIIVSRLWAILEAYKNEIVRLSRRKDSQLHWCKWLTDERPQKSIQYYYIKNMSKDFTRYLAINNTNRKTIEFRFFRGTLNFDTYMAAVEFINNLYTNALDIKKPLNEITWQVLTQGEYISAYVTEKNIQTDKTIKDDYKKIFQYDCVIEFEIKRMITMLEHKTQKYYKAKLKELNHTKEKELYYAFSHIDNYEMDKISEIKRMLTNKDYKKILDELTPLVSKYIDAASRQGHDTMLKAYCNAKENMYGLEAVLCA